jgi:hypothetical protein
MKPEVIVLGAGGHAKVVVSTLQASGYTVPCVYDDDPAKWGSEVLGVRVTGPLAQAAEGSRRLAILGFGENRLRKSLAARLPFEWASVVHPAAYLHPSVRLGAGTIVCAGAILHQYRGNDRSRLCARGLRSHCSRSTSCGQRASE